MTCKLANPAPIEASNTGYNIGGLWKGFNDLHRLGLIDRLPLMIGAQTE